MEKTKTNHQQNQTAAPAISDTSENIQPYDRNGTGFVLKFTKRSSLVP